PNGSAQKTIDHALALAKAAQDEVARHVGYYLIDAGRPVLEQATSARVSLAERSRRWIRAHATSAYFGSLLLLMAALVAAPLLFVDGLVPSVRLALLGFLRLMPAGEPARRVANCLGPSLV